MIVAAMSTALGCATGSQKPPEGARDPGGTPSQTGRGPEAASAIAVSANDYELSGMAAVRGGYLVADDELVGAVLFLADPPESPALARRIKLERRGRESAPHGPHPKLFPVQDIEAIASDGDTRVFVAGSHSPRWNGDRREDREFLLRFEFEPSDSGEHELEFRAEGFPTPPGEAKRSLLDVLDAAIDERGLAVDRRPALGPTRVYRDLDLEGLAYDGTHLYLGLRGPLDARGRALLLVIPEAEAFAPGGRPAGAVAALDLGGEGIRSLSWDAERRELVALAGSTLYWLDPDGFAVLERRDISREVGDRGAPEGIARTHAGDRILVAIDAGEHPAGVGTILTLPERPSD